MDKIQIDFLLKTYELTRNEIISLQSSFYSGLILTVISIFAGAIAWSFREKFRLTDLREKIRDIIFPALVLFFITGTSLTLCSTITMIIDLGYKNWKIEEDLKVKMPELVQKYAYEHQTFKIHKEQVYIFRLLNKRIFPNIAKKNLIHKNFPYITFLCFFSSLLIGVFLSINIILSDRNIKYLLFGIFVFLITLGSFTVQCLFISLLRL